jgi:hypothetical protein
MISSRNGFRRNLMCAMLLVSILLMAGCGPAPTPTPQVITKVETKVVKETQIVKETKVVEVPPEPPTSTPLPPPEDLDPAEEWLLYPPGVEPEGDGELVPGYGPMRQGVAAMIEEVEEMLDKAGMKINTARTVVLAEPGNLSQATGLNSDAVLVGFVEQKVDHPGGWHTDFLVYDNGKWRREASKPWQLTNASISTATANECPGAASRTHVTTQDNEDNDYTGSPDGDMGGSEPPCVFRDDADHPIEFNIDVASLPVGLSEAWLSLRVWDVDEEVQDCGEEDAVYFNGNFVGYLRGADEKWSTSGPYKLDPAWVLQGNNLVEIQVNTDDCPGPGGEGWCVSVQQGTLKLEGGTGAASKRSFLESPRCWPPGSTCYVEVEVDTTLGSQEVRVEINVIDAQNNVLVGDSQTEVIHGTQDDAFGFDLPIPADAHPGDYTIQVIIYDTCSETIQESQGHAVRIDCATLVETVSIAPVVAEDPNAFDQAKLEELLATEGVVLGMLVLETNWPNSLVPSGAYLERAWLDEDQRVVELIDVTSGDIYYVGMLAEKVEDPGLIPSASIFLGSKWCLTRIDGWLFCLPCFFWMSVMNYDECCRHLPGCTPP